MRTVRLRNGRHHWVQPPPYQTLTLCGRELWSLSVEREYEIEHLPPGEICVPCEAARQEGYAELHARTILPPSYGTLRKVGPLHHGPKSLGLQKGGGIRLPPHS